jgi:hypothetical protein
VSFLLKIKGAPWLQGTALFYVYHLDELRRFPLPWWFFHPIVLKLAGWSALVLEFSLAILIWVREFRYFLLALGVSFHLWLEYSLNIPLFQWDVLSAYILFVDPADIARAWDWIKRRSAGRSGKLASLPAPLRQSTACLGIRDSRREAGLGIIRQLGPLPHARRHSGSKTSQLLKRCDWMAPRFESWQAETKPL